MNNKNIDNDGSNERTISNGALPGFLGNEGKCKEISSIFATILARGCYQGNEGQGTIQNHWLDPVEPLAKYHNIWIDSLSSLATVEIGYGHENTVFLSKDGDSVIKFNNLKYVYDEESLIKFIERINSHNEFSIEAPYTLLGFTRNPKNDIGLVMSQPFVKQSMEADSYTIENYLKKRGFRNEYLKTNDRKGWTNDVFEFNDAVPRNVLMDLHGDLYFIDLQINNPKRLSQYLSDYKKYKENQVSQIITRRIKDPAVKSFKPEEYAILRQFVSDKKTPEERKTAFNDIFSRIVENLEWKYQTWAKKTLDELNDFAEGK